MLSSNALPQSISSPFSTSDQWAAILRYDASRKHSAASSSSNTLPASDPKNRRNSDQASEAALSKQPKRLSLGNDLPHMPVEPSTYPMLPRSSLASSNLDKADSDDAYLSMERPETPPAFKGDNAILVDREVDRLRHRHLKSTRRHWRIYTGTTRLVVLGLFAFVLAKYILAYLALSPADWLLSDTASGIHTSPDPLLRVLALIGVCASATALMGALSSGFYLRFSRRRSCGTLLVWIAAITSTTISILLCVVNLALIAIWNKKYSSFADDFAATRDVSRRCSGSWALDILWQAAKSSSQAKLDKDNSPTYLHDAKATLQDYLIAGGIRLIVVIAFCTLWLICLARYNRTLQLVEESVENIEESAEMHKLLMEADEGKLSSKTEVQKDSGSYTNKSFEVKGSSPPVPSLNPTQYRWHKESSTMEQAQTYDKVHEQHRKELSAGAWSASFVGQVWGALWGTNEAGDRHQVAQDDVDDDNLMTPLHDRQATKLGVRGWFRRDASELASEDYGRVVGYIDDHDQLPAHPRISSQEKRAREGRHAAARLAKLRQEESVAEARSREERRRSEQQQRLEFLASLAGDGNRDEPNEGHPSRRSSQSAGNDLPHMPELTTHIRNDCSDEEEDIFWQPSQDHEASEDQDKIAPTHLYVRTMGKLIRTLSAIESQGSQERLDRAGRSGASGSDLY